MPFKMIPVYPAVHERVKALAAGRRQSMGELVASWANDDCDHPADKRRVMIVSYQLPADLRKGTKPRDAVGFVCGVCGRLVISAK